MPYFDGDYISFFNLLHKYVDAKSYNTSFCDLVPIIMSNVLDEVIVKIDENIDDNFVTVLSPRTRHLIKRGGTSLGIFLLKTSDHHDACIPAHSTDLNVNSPTLAGHCVNSLDLKTHEYNNGNVPASVHHHSLAINAIQPPRCHTESLIYLAILLVVCVTTRCIAITMMTSLIEIRRQCLLIMPYWMSQFHLMIFHWIPFHI